MLYKYYWSVFGSEESLQSTPQQGCSTAGSQRGTLLLAVSRYLVSITCPVQRSTEGQKES